MVRIRNSAAILASVAFLALAASAPVLAQGDAAAGRFIAVTGEVKIVGADGATRDAERGGEFRQGESIVTGSNALAQVRMTDGGALSVRADSQLKLEGYRFQGKDDPEPSFFASLIKGGFRTLTGLIGRGRRDSYRVATTSATMGIRGTHFEIVHVVRPLPDAAPGTYNRVYDGIVAIQNRAGVELLVTRDQTVFVALPGNVAPVLVRPPAGIYSKPTPVPIFKPQARDAGDAGDAAAHKDRAAHKDKAVAPRVREALGNKDSPAILAPRTAQPVESSPSLSPIEAPKTTISPTLTSPLLTPIDTPTTISPTLTAPTTTTISPTLTAPTTTTISPTAPKTSDPAISTTISPTTTTISPTLTAPTTTTISPTLTAPTTTTISPTLTAPTTTTISPTLTAPTTTTISPTLTAPTTTTISPTLTAPTTTTISPTLTAPSTTTISPALTAPTTTIKK